MTNFSSVRLYNEVHVSDNHTILTSELQINPTVTILVG
jgi:hypothetical protein